MDEIRRLQQETEQLRAQVALQNEQARRARNELANEKVWDKLSSWSYNRCKKYIEFFNKSIPDGATNGDVVKTLLNQ